MKKYKQKSRKTKKRNSQYTPFKEFQRNGKKGQRKL
nr:MAG TPA: hypothetical protein [Caudoviricetes sp.]